MHVHVSCTHTFSYLSVLDHSLMLPLAPANRMSECIQNAAVLLFGAGDTIPHIYKGTC